MTSPHLTLGLTPAGSLHLFPAEPDSPAIDTGDSGAASRISKAFNRSPNIGLLHLGSVELDTHLPPSFAFFRDLAREFVTRLCSVGDLEEKRGRVAIEFPALEMTTLLLSAPPFPGGEYLSPAALESLWSGLHQAFKGEIEPFKGTVQSWLKEKNPVWNLVGRVHFHLAENKSDPDHPFAFLATYTTRLSAAARVQHLPLGQALKSFARDRAALIALLSPVERAAEKSPLVRKLVDGGDLFSPLAWTAEEAYQFLRETPACEAAGVMVRVPDWWKARRRVQVSVSVGDAEPAGFGVDALLDFSVSLALDGDVISEKEWKKILASTDGLALIRGKWVELDRERLKAVLARWTAVQARTAEEGIGFSQAMRLVAGGGLDDVDNVPGAGGDDAASWSQVEPGRWLGGVLSGLRTPEALAAADPGADLQATLRPYQLVGVRWLQFLSKLGLGACLADDMGLGKTLQVIGLLLCLRRNWSMRKDAARNPSLLVVPASLVGNWCAEIERFAPSLRVLVAHPSVMSSRDLASLPATIAARRPHSPQSIDPIDLVITTYGTAQRLPCLSEMDWELLILDEAQAIKNPDAKQTRAVKALKSRARVALTGTPIENRLTDLFSLFDFLNPGLLSNAKSFAAASKRFASDDKRGYAPLRELIRPYILRRLKTDKTVIADLPEKTEVRAFCSLAKKQAVLYQQSVEELAERLKKVDGMERRGLVLAFLIRLKQICNHPSQWLRDGSFVPSDSGKFARLTEIAEEISSRQEKALIFTQFREMTGPLQSHLATIFKRDGLSLHGQTKIADRKALVDRFQNDDDVPFFVLSLKAGGTGLNLTAASHVIHFDRWWNPAVENQATDRAFRIGQKKNVLVHQFVCRGTVEEQIDALIERKRGLSTKLLEGGGEGEVLLTEMSDEELLRLVRLDLHAANAGD